MLYYYGPLSPLQPIWSIYKKMGYTRVGRAIQNQDGYPPGKIYYLRQLAAFCASLSMPLEHSDCTQTDL